MTMWFDGARPIQTMSPPNSCVPISTRDEVALVTILLNAVILAGLAAAGAEPTFSWIGRKIARLVLNCEGRSFISCVRSWASGTERPWRQMKTGARAICRKAATFHCVAAFVLLEIANRDRYGSLKSPACSGVSITLPVVLILFLQKLSADRYVVRSHVSISLSK
jgi:hypothetical protein